jgi:nitroreductase
MTNVMNIIFTRRSIRKYTNEPVSQEQLTLLLQAAMAAPTACNNRLWEFIVITDRAMMDELRRVHEHGRYNAPAAIIVCANPEIAQNEGCNPYWVQDCSAATENILIAAAGLGLGTVWLGVYPREQRVAAVRDALSIPAHVTPLCIIHVGHPAEDKPPRTQYDAQHVYWQHYGNREA